MLKNNVWNRVTLSLVEPVSTDPDRYRREFILNILLLSSLFVSTATLLLSFTNDLVIKTQRNGTSFGTLFLIFLFFCLLYVASKKGYSRISSYLLILSYFIVTTNLIVKFGVDVPQALLIYSLIIVMAGILVNSKVAFIVTFGIIIILLVLTYLSSIEIIHFEVSWKEKPTHEIDTVVTSITLLIISIVSWLFNRESENVLKRARASELALKKQRDTLAQKVEEKTKELRQEQSEKIAQLYQFAEFGKLASGIMHDLSNSVHLVSANLKQLEKNNSLKDMKEVIARANVGTRRLYSFIDATRKQANNQEFVEYFSVNDEVDQVIQILSHKAKEHKVSITSVGSRKVWTSGNSIKFHQLMCNLVSNAIDSYDRSRRKKREVKISLTSESHNIKIEVVDFGKGIAKKNLNHIFDPFFTTKGFKKGTGIGLSISHGIITKDFKGEILVKSKPNIGSTFTIVFPIRKKV